MYTVYLEDGDGSSVGVSGGDRLGVYAYCLSSFGGVRSNSAILIVLIVHNRFMYQLYNSLSVYLSIYSSGFKIHRNE